jgi:Putative peptidoglycan binding domain
MSRRRFTTPPLAPEDDWFAEPDAPSSEAREQARPSPASTSAPRTRPVEPRRTIRPESLRRRRIVVAVAVGAVLLLVGGVLAARAVTGPDDDGEATTTTSPTTAPTTFTTTTTTPPTTTSPTTTTTTTPTGTTLPEGVVLRPGDESEEVRQLQTALVELGYSTGGVDGKFGPTTEQAVQEFQSSSGLEDDGVAGPATLAALAAALNER